MLKNLPHLPQHLPKKEQKKKKNENVARLIHDETVRLRKERVVATSAPTSTRLRNQAGTGVAAASTPTHCQLRTSAATALPVEAGTVTHTVCTQMQIKDRQIAAEAIRLLTAERNDLHLQLGTALPSKFNLPLPSPMPYTDTAHTMRHELHDDSEYQYEFSESESSDVDNDIGVSQRHEGDLSNLVAEIAEFASTCGQYTNNDNSSHPMSLPQYHYKY